MNEQLRCLRNLQQVNDKIRECEDEKAALRAALEKRRLESKQHQHRLEELHQKIIDEKKQEDRHNLDLKSNEADINKLLFQLTQARTNEEYSGIEKRIKEEQAQNSALEDSILKLMDDIETMESEQGALKDKLQTGQKELADFEAEVARDSSAIDVRIHEHQGTVAEIEESIEAEVLGKYHRLFERFDGDVMVGLDMGAGICLGCNLPVTKQDMNLILADNDIIFCKSCSRILYILE